MTSIEYLAIWSGVVLIVGSGVMLIVWKFSR
jgi:hypothetical protein